MKQERHISDGKACVQCYLSGFEQLISKRITRIKNIVVSILSLTWTLFLGKVSASYNSLRDFLAIYPLML